MKIFIFAILVFFCSCINFKTKSYVHKEHHFVGDCINDSLVPIIDLKLKKLGFDNIDTFDYKGHNHYKYSMTFTKKDNDSSKFFNIWSFQYKNNVFEAINTYGDLHDLSTIVHNTLSADKKDTLFWNVINFLNQYCDLRDSIDEYVFIKTPFSKTYKLKE